MGQRPRGMEAADPLEGDLAELRRLGFNDLQLLSEEEVAECCELGQLDQLDPVRIKMHTRYVVCRSQRDVSNSFVQEIGLRTPLSCVSLLPGLAEQAQLGVTETRVRICR